MNERAIAVEARALTRSFGAAQAVSELSFRAYAGEIFGLVGPDGAGKTTTMRMLAGVMRPDRGGASVAGFDVVRDPQTVKNHIAYMPQRFGLYDDLTVDENIRFYADLFGVTPSAREEHRARLLAAAGMAEFRARLAGNLSGGMKQKLALTCALIHRPDVILLDEPTNGVDPVSRREFWEILYGLLAEGVTVLISTAYLDEAERCHRLGLMRAGRMLFCGTPDALKRGFSGATISIATANPRAVEVALAAAPGLISMVAVGTGVRAVVDRAERIDEIRGRLVAAAVACESVERIAPSVEDVFIASVSSGSDGAKQG
jgi:ABC-2 type transport system ATP-binding protein